eukprot:CAMPEP_0116013620 /NCGR_PEP_ID=MMETSP0321-20121206/5828_1 /TAXON_ID=163516 /ORGANISM="Leptocylindrus danicus var. danicus, Strain B650" /LENGTH=672 /DNA_ID=CAMNT_0003483191 /DNA_START=45 /DNA_END=2060 /DNA_ORIENTATION=+
MAATLFLLLFGNASANYNTIRGRRTNLPENTFANNRNKHLLNDELSCILLLKEIKFSDGSESEEADCLDPVTGEITKITGPYDAQKIFLEGFKTGELTSNKSTLTKNGGAQAYFDDDAGELVLPDWEQLEIGRGNPKRAELTNLKASSTSMRLSTQALAALFLLPSDSVSANNTLRGRRRLPGNAIGKTKNKHPLDESPCILLLKEIKFLDGSESEEADCLEPSTGAISKITGPQGTQKIFLDGFKNGELMSNVSTLRKNGAQAYFDDDSGELVLPDWDHLVIGHGNPNANKNGRELWKHVARSDDETRMVGDGSRRSLATVIGDKEMLAIRVIAPDASMSSSESDISDSWFGTSGDLVNLKSQYEACSYGQLRCEGASKTTSTGATVSNGVHTIEISSTVSGVADGTVRTAVVNEATTALGSLSGQFDHVILCLPPGTAGSWIAYAYVNHWLSVYNDEWCNYVSGQMHEIGHNLNLAHSGEGTLAYGDQTGMMGYSYSSDDGPEMCFNAPKNWQLGWYNDGQKVVTSGWSGNLYGIADYGTIDSGSVVIAQIPASVNGGTDDWYVSFNRKAGINAGTVEGGNQVLVHKRASGTGYAESTLMAKLSAGGTYSGAPLPIEVSAIDISQSPGFATVLIGTLATPAPVTPAPVTPAPVTPAPVTPAPVTSAPVTP